MKKSTKQTKKRKALLSTADLQEIVSLLQEFIKEEISVPFKKGIFQALEHNTRRISELEMYRRVNDDKQRQKNKIPCSHFYRFSRVEYSKITGQFLTAVFGCTACGQESHLSRFNLTRKETLGLKKLGVIQK